MSENTQNVLSLFKELKDAVLFLDGKKRVLWCNAAAEELFQKAGVTLSGLSFLEAAQSLELERLVDEARASQKPVVKEVRLARHDEKFLVCQMIPAAPVSSCETVCVLQDFTKFYRLETIRRDFAANVSHELKTPVASIKSLAETLLRGAKDDASVRDPFIRSLHHETERLSQILQDLLDLLRFESGEFHLQKKQLHLRAMSENVIQNFKEDIAQKNLHAEIFMPENLPDIPADENGVKHILENLVDNAIKYTPEGGALSVCAEHDIEKKEVCVFVKDTGVGIPSSDLPRIFERFYTVDKTRSREVGGTGLGLSIVKHLVEAHGGRAWAESRLNHGSTFYFTLPVTS